MLYQTLIQVDCCNKGQYCALIKSIMLLIFSDHILYILYIFWP